MGRITMKQLDRWLGGDWDMKCVLDMEFALARIITLAEFGGRYNLHAYYAAEYYIRTGRIGGGACFAIAANFRDVCKKLNRMGSASYEEVGAYLKTFYPEG